jgi:hypothetical protein
MQINIYIFIYFPYIRPNFMCAICNTELIFTAVRTLPKLIKSQHHSKAWQSVSTLIRSSTGCHFITNISIFRYKSYCYGHVTEIPIVYIYIYISHKENKSQLVVIFIKPLLKIFTPKDCCCKR